MNPIADDSQILTEPVEWPDWTIISPRRASTSSTTASTVVPAATGMRRSTSGGHRVSQSQANLRHRLLRSHNSDDANSRYGAELEETGNSTLTRQQSSPPMIAEQSTPPTSNSIMFASPAVPDSSRLPLVRVTSQITTPDNISMPTEAEKAVHKFTSLAYTACMLASLACTFLAPPKSVIKTAYMNVPIEWWGIYLVMTIFWTIWLGLHSTKQILFSTSIYVSKRISGAIATITLLAPLWNLYPLSVSAGYTISCLVTPFFHIVFHIFYTLWELYSKERAVMEKLTAKEVRAVADQGEQLLSEAEERRTASVKMITEEIRDASRIGKASIMRLAPPAVLAAYSREHLAACSIPIPTASIASVDAVLSHIEHLGKHLECLNNTTPLLDHKDSPLSGHLPQFDVGELLQRVGDMMAGCATCAKVEVVIYHAEAQICHRMVYGDETRYQHMLFNLLKMVILSAAPGDWVELGLAVTAAKPNAAKPPMGANEPHTRAINCTFRITHSPMNNDPFAISHIPNANESLKMITELNGQLVMEQKDDGLHVIDIVLPFAATSRSSPSSPSLNHGKSRTLSNGMRTSSTSCTASEPTLDELRRFISTLRNRAVALYATNRSILAKHVTAWLTLWSTDISHISTDENKTDEAELIRVSSNASFILIDDDIATLEQLLQQRPPSSRGRARSVPGNGSNESGEIVEEYPPNASASMANGHNSNHKSENGHESRSNTILVNNGRRSIIYFTSIGHYQKVKQAVADVFSNLPPFPLMTPPQVLVIPKPIGPRRF
ncbi:hypothetical protein BDF19DRAFT_421909 [Syncephalis fuscata]|nr:hypothetical protein BDF19DRAFT_421909 [Syncephalis fuscata]